MTEVEKTLGNIKDQIVTAEDLLNLNNAQSYTVHEDSDSEEEEHQEPRKKQKGSSSVGMVPVKQEVETTSKIG